MPALGIAAQSEVRRLIEALQLAEILLPESGAMRSNRSISEGDGARLARNSSGAFLTFGDFERTEGDNE